MKYRVMIMIPKEEGDREDVFEQRWAHYDEFGHIQETTNELKATLFSDVVEAVNTADELKSLNHYFDYVTIELRNN